MVKEGMSQCMILLVEDSSDDVLITKRAISKGQIPSKLFVVPDGEEAIKFFRKEGEYKGASAPSFVLLDLNMPKLNGFEVLKELKKDENLKVIPIIVLTSSTRNEDVEKAYKLGANSYVVKPIKFEDFIETIEEIKRYWLEISEIPAK